MSDVGQTDLPPPRLSICIPTHHGRRAELAELLGYLVAAIDLSGHRQTIEICISDNASEDGTQALVAAWMSAHPGLIYYGRNPVNIGIRNFFTVVAMARGEFAWMIGSDDAILPDAIARIFSCLDAHPGLAGLTLNKLNFNAGLDTLIGPDHSIVLPDRPEQSRLLRGPREILGELFMPFLFISAHVFRKDLWDEVLAVRGMPTVLAFEHFVHAYLYSEIGLRGGGWYWLAEYCVIQRLENFSYWTEVSQRKLDYAEQHTIDLTRIANHLYGEYPDLRDRLMRRLFVLYWNPIYLLHYLADVRISSEEWLRVRQECTGWFGRVALYRLTTWPMQCLPLALSRPIACRVLRVARRVRQTQGWQHLRAVGRLMAEQFQRAKDRCAADAPGNMKVRALIFLQSRVRHDAKSSAGDDAD